MVSKKVIINAIDMLNMDQCEMAERIKALENQVATLNGKLKSMIAPPKTVKTATKTKMSKDLVKPKKAAKKVAKRPASRPSNKKK